jgi:8-oxo-dGTP pyrophosphatase MutT (NUDIX family)
LVFAKETGRFLIDHRSHEVREPHTWGVWGGAIDSNEDPKMAAEREVREETGYRGSLEMIPAYVFTQQTFRYSNFIGIVDTEYRPSLGWESQGYRWCKYGEWPTPMHFGLKALLSDPKTQEIIKSLLEPK